MAYGSYDIPGSLCRTAQWNVSALGQLDGDQKAVLVDVEGSPRGQWKPCNWRKVFFVMSYITFFIRLPSNIVFTPNCRKCMCGKCTYNLYKSFINARFEPGLSKLPSWARTVMS